VEEVAMEHEDDGEAEIVEENMLHLVEEVEIVVEGGDHPQKAMKVSPRR